MKVSSLFDNASHVTPEACQRSLIPLLIMAQMALYVYNYIISCDSIHTKIENRANHKSASLGGDLPMQVVIISGHNRWHL